MLPTAMGAVLTSQSASNAITASLPVWHNDVAACRGSSGQGAESAASVLLIQFTSAVTASAVYWPFNAVGDHYEVVTPAVVEFAPKRGVELHRLRRVGNCCHDGATVSIDQQARCARSAFRACR